MSPPLCLAPDACASRSFGSNCRRCTVTAMNRDPKFAAKRKAGLQKLRNDPEYVKRHAEACRAGILREMEEGGLERRRQQGLEHYSKRLNTPEARANNTAPEVRARAGLAGSETKMAFCPPEYREMYFELRRRRGLRKAEAMAVIEGEIAHKAGEAARIIAHHTQRMIDKESRRRAQAY